MTSTAEMLADRLAEAHRRLEAAEGVVAVASKVVDDALMSALSGKPPFPGYIDQLHDALTAYAATQPATESERAS